MNEKRLFLLDAYALIFRAYYALIKIPRTTSAGFNTSAIFGFVNTLEELLRTQKPSHLAVCFDPQGPTFRHKTLESYKGERQETPEDIRLSIPYIKDIIKAYNIPMVEVEGFEADDVIGTLAKMAEADGFTTYMMTPDKDFGQLVTTNVLQYKPSYRGQDFEIRGPEEVCARYNIKRPAQVIDLLALMGDKIDNIPGCPGVGEKTAEKLIADFENVDNLLLHTDSLKGALRKKVEENAELIRLSKFLATIRTDVPVNITPEELKVSMPDRRMLFDLFRTLEFRTLEQRVARRLDGQSNTKSEEPAMTPSEEKEVEPLKINFIVVDNLANLEKMEHSIANMASAGLFLLTEGENDMGAQWNATAIAADNGGNFFIPADFKEALPAVLDFMARPDVLKCTSQCKRFYTVASRFRTDSLPPLANYFDSVLAHYLLQPEHRHDIDMLAPAYLHLRPIDDSGADSGDAGLFHDIMFSQAQMERCCQEAYVALHLRKPLLEELKKENMLVLYNDVELPVTRVLAEMEITGVLIDTDALREASATLQKELEATAREALELAGVRFNIGSPKEVGELLFSHLALDDKAKRTKSGQYSTSEAVLEKLVGKHPVVPLIMRYRQLKKLISTWLEALPEAKNAVTGRVHTNYNQTIAATGRLSSSSPNLQSIPVRNELGREIRRAFIADPGCLFLSADYSQIELRLVADFAKDKTMLDAFNSGKDIHSITAAKIYKIPEQEVTADQRRNAKTANFGILYGISAFGLASRLNISRSEAKMLIDGYNETFPTVHKFMADTVVHARENGFTTTISGRRRMQPDINSRNPVVRGYAERNAINAPVQGSAADIIKVAMISIYAEMQQRGLKSKMVMQVHDELNFNVPESEREIMRELVVRNMENAYKGSVRLEASCGIGHNWLEAH